MDRRSDLSMFAGFYMGKLIVEGAAFPEITYDKISEWISEYVGKIRPTDSDERELEAVFEARWKADQRAIKMWQEANPGNDLVWPDHGDMVVWLLERLDEREQWIAKLEDTVVELQDANSSPG